MQEQAAAAAAPAEAPLLLTQASQAGQASGAAAPAFAAPGPSRSVSPALKTPGKGLGRKAAGSAGPAPGISAEAPVGHGEAAGPAPGNDRAHNEPGSQHGSDDSKGTKRRAGSGDGENGKAAAKSGSQLAKRRRAEAADRSRLPSDEGTLSVQCAQPVPTHGTETASAAVAATVREAHAAAGIVKALAAKLTAEQRAARDQHGTALARDKSAPLARRQRPAAAAGKRRGRKLLGPKVAPKVAPFSCTICHCLQVQYMK